MGTSKNVRALGVALAASGALALSIGAYPASGNAAGTANGSMPVKLTVASQCTVQSISTLDFGSATFVDNNIPGQATFTVRCTKTTPYRVSMLNGQNFTNSTRNMKNASTGELISYSLYRDQALTTAWGSTPSSSPPSGIGTTNFTVYGLVAPQGNGEFTPGDYTDNVTIQVDY